MLTSFSQEPAVAVAVSRYRGPHSTVTSLVTICSNSFEVSVVNQL